MKYRVHQFNIKMTNDSGKLEQFLNNLEGEVVAGFIFPFKSNLRQIRLDKVLRLIYTVNITESHSFYFLGNTLLKILKH